MPLTWFAHQVPVIGIKLVRPTWVDGTALCVGSMMPDVLYACSSYVHIDTHRWPSAYSYGVPAGVVLALLVRFASPVAARQLPDLGQFRLQSFAVLASRRPRLAVTVVCVAIGVMTHVVLDSFTHPGRPAARWLGYDDVRVHVLGHSEPLAGVFQIIGHTVGSVVAVLLLRSIGRRRLLEAWYGADLVERARSWTPDAAERVIFWAAVSAGVLGGATWAWHGDWVEQIQRVALGPIAGGIVGSAMVVRRRGRRHSSGWRPS
ncbi:MAG: DUF4184 family protein [Actinobacteria bacterium]|nr:DUF4184 family protein [Actinomycetota bacterium]